MEGFYSADCTEAWNPRGCSPNFYKPQVRGCHVVSVATKTSQVEWNRAEGWMNWYWVRGAVGSRKVLLEIRKSPAFDRADMHRCRTHAYLVGSPTTLVHHSKRVALCVSLMACT